MRVYHLISRDGARTWSERRQIDLSPWPGASPTGPILRLGDGALAQPFEHWKEYEDASPGVPGALLRVSRDGGRTWAEDMRSHATRTTPSSGGTSGLPPIRSTGALSRCSGPTTRWPGATGTSTSLGRARRARWSVAGADGADRGSTASRSRSAATGWWRPTPTAAIRPASGSPSRDDFGRTWDRSTRGGGLRVARPDPTPGGGGPRAPADYWNDMGAWQFGHPRGALLPGGEVFVAFYGGSGFTRPARWARVAVDGG